MAGADRLLMAAYDFPSRPSELEMYLAAQPDGWFVLVDRGEIVAVGGALAYGSFCWLGLVATEPTRQRQGLATTISTHLVDWARERGCTTVALDASAAGRPVYERLGFRVVGETTELAPPAAVRDAKSPSTVRRNMGPIDNLLAFDRQVFGGDRARLLQALSSSNDSRCYVAAIGGEVVGYMFARRHRLGPGCAPGAEIARDLVHAALADRAHTNEAGEPRLLLPFESRYLDALSQLGLRVERRLAHMRLGPPALPGRREELIAQTSYAAG